jgi:hypothetical protein
MGIVSDIRCLGSCGAWNKQTMYRSLAFIHFVAIGLIGAPSLAAGPYDGEWKGTVSTDA